MNPRCPECDIELDCSSDRYVCPLCGETPRPGQYLQVPSPVYQYDSTPLRDVATEAAQLLIEIVQDDPGLKDRLLKPYTMMIDLAERNDKEQSQNG